MRSRAKLKVYLSIVRIPVAGGNLSTVMVGYMICVQKHIRNIACCRTIVLICLLLQIGTTAADETLAGEADGWVAVAMTGNGQIYHRAVEGSPVPMVMMATTFRADAARVQALVSDYDHFAEFIPNVQESRVLMRDGSQQWVFHHLHFPGPVADRVYVFRSTASGGSAEPGYRVEWQLSDRLFPGIDTAAGIRPRQFSGFWELRPAAHGTVTEARYAVHSDPGGLIPAWLVARMTDRYVQQVIGAVRERLAQH